MPFSILSFPLKEFFFSISGRTENKPAARSRQSVRCCQPSSHFRASFAALFRSTKLRRDFHKAQRRAENSPVIREWQGERKGWYGATKWKGNFAIHVVKTHGMSYLFLLSVSVAILSKNRKNFQNYDQFYKVCVSLYICIVVSKKED